MGRRLIFIKKAIVYDPDALAFLTATGITDLTISNAINQLVLDLKSNSIWSKMTAIYPFVGGTGTTHKYNLKNPLDTDAAHRITYTGAGGPAHSSDGIRFAGSSGGNTYIIPSSHMTLNNTCISLSSTTNIDASGADLQSSGCIAFYIRAFGGIYSDMYNVLGGDGRLFVSNSNSVGFFVTSRLAGPLYNVYVNGTSVASSTVTAGSLGGNNLLFLTSNRIFNFCTVGLGLTSGEVATLTTIKSNFNTALGR